jgi:DNA polymerase III subunit beta
MNISLSTKALAEALSKLEKVVPTKAALPILSHVLINADDNAVWLSCTDTELALTRTVNAVVNAAGMITLPVKPLLDVVSQITEPDVHLFFEKSSARIAAGQFKMQMQAMRVQEFPTMPVADSKNALPLSGTDLRSIIRKVRSGITDTAKRYCIQGALLILSKEMLALVTTDGKRLALAVMLCNGPAERVEVILPTKLLDSLVEDDADSYNFSIGANQLFFESEQSTLSSNRIDAKFPNWQRTRQNAEANTNTMTVARDALLSALRRVSLASGDGKIVRFDIGNETLQLRANNTLLGDANENIKVEYQGNATHVNLQSETMISFLENATSATITMQLGDATAPALLKDGTDFVTIAMAVRT